jgi:uncharacterized membrane protein (GlpM family)
VLALKLGLAPALIGLATLAARRWGPAAAGWAASLPVVGGPVLLVVALQHGQRFAAHAATSATIGLLSLALFGAAYVRVAAAGRPWWVALPAGWLAFAVSTTVLVPVHLPVAADFAVVVGGCVAVHRLLGWGVEAAAGGRRLPFDLPLRMTAGAVMVAALSAASAPLGPRLTGLLTPFPVIASVLAGFTHATEGLAAVRRYADALVRGLPSFAAFTATIAWSVREVGVAAAFTMATVVALASHAVLITRPWRGLAVARPLSTPVD